VIAGNNDDGVVVGAIFFQESDPVGERGIAYAISPSRGDPCISPRTARAARRDHADRISAPIRSAGLCDVYQTNFRRVQRHPFTALDAPPAWLHLSVCILAIVLGKLS